MKPQEKNNPFILPLLLRISPYTFCTQTIHS